MDESQSEREKPQTTPTGAAGRPGRGLLRSAARAARTAPGAREWPGWILAAAGAALCVLGWYGVSGEAFVEQQIPYLASSTVPGAALIVAGIVLVALRSLGRPPAPPTPPTADDLTDRRVERLYTLLVEPEQPEEATAPEEPAASRTGLLAVAEGTLYHRPDCPLVTGKHGARPVDAAAVRARGLHPCRICAPAAPDAAADPADPAHPAG